MLRNYVLTDKFFLVGNHSFSKTQRALHHLSNEKRGSLEVLGMGGRHHQKYNDVK